MCRAEGLSETDEARAIRFFSRKRRRTFSAAYPSGVLKGFLDVAHDAAGMLFGVALVILLSFPEFFRRLD